MNQQKGISMILSVLIALLVIAGGVVVYNYYYAPGEKPSTGEPGESQDETADWETYRNEEHGFEIKYPENWEPIKGYGDEDKGYYRYGGETGFFSFMSATEKDINEVCKDLAYHKLNPYGSQPKIESSQIQGQDACLVIPSEDQPESEEGAMALITAFPQSINISGTEYYTFVLIVDKNHMEKIAKTFKFIEVVSESDTYSPENYSFDKQQVGEPTDGQGLNLIRRADHEDYYRFVFDITDQYGSEENYIVIPFTEAFYAHSAKTIGLVINGIRRDLTDNQVEKPIMVDHEVVASYVRNKVYDDQAIGYTIALNKDAKFYLHALTNPVRIILDIEK